MPQSELTANEINNEMQDADVCAVVHAYLFPEHVYYDIDPYEWWRWRFDRLPTWLLRQLLWPNENPGPYGSPVYAYLAQTLSTQESFAYQQGEGHVAMMRRWLLSTVAEQN